MFSPFYYQVDVLKFYPTKGGVLLPRNLFRQSYFGHVRGQAHNTYYNEGRGSYDGPVAGQQEKKTHTDYARTYIKVLGLLKK